MTDPGITQLTRVNVIESLTINGVPVTPGGGGFDPNSDQVITGQWSYNLTTKPSVYYAVSDVDNILTDPFTIVHTVNNDAGGAKIILSQTSESTSTFGSNASLSISSDPVNGGSSLTLGDIGGTNTFSFGSDGEGNTIFTGISPGQIAFTSGSGVLALGIATGATFGASVGTATILGDNISLQAVNNSIQANAAISTDFVDTATSDTLAAGSAVRVTGAALTQTLPNTGSTGDVILIACANAGGTTIAAELGATTNVVALTDGQVAEMRLVIDSSNTLNWKGQAL